MGVQHAAAKDAKARIFRHVRGREVARGHDHIVKFFLIHPVFNQIMRHQGEIALGLVILHKSHGMAKADPRAHAGLFDAAFDIVDHDRARRVRRDLLAEMLFKRIVGKFQALFRAIGPKVAIHRAMHRLAKLIQASAPCIIPKPAPIALLFKADHLGDLFPFGACRLEGAQLCQP